MSLIMNVLITGANGFLGYYLAKSFLENDCSVIATGREECRLPFSDNKNFIYMLMDFTDPFSVHDVFEEMKPEVVVHAGAMSKPDECEQNQMQAYITNVEGTLNLLINAAECKSFFIFLSTDFVFDGERGMYSEVDNPNPVNYYGRTKLEAEEAVREYEHDWAIVRTVLVYGRNFSGRKNFVELVKDKMENKQPYSLVDDQHRTPTYAGDLATGIVSIVNKKKTGVFHLSGNEMMTPYSMGKKIAGLFGLDFSVIQKVNAASFFEPAKRPTSTGFNISKAEKELGFTPISFEEGLRKTFG